MLSLRLIISALFLLLTLATAGTILGVFLSFTTKATNEIADAHIKALADNTGLAIEGWMEKAVGEHTAFQRWFYTQSFPYPFEIRANATDPMTYLDFIHDHMFGILSSAGYVREAGIVIGFADHTLTYTGDVGGGEMIKVTYVGHSLEPVGVYNASLDDRITDVHPYQFHKIGPRRFRFVDKPPGDVHTFPWWNMVPHDQPLAIAWDNKVRLAGSPSIGCAYALHTRDDTFYGVMTDEIDIEHMQNFLLQAERSENTNSFLLDNTNGIIATTHNTTLQVILNSTEPRPEGMACTVTFLDQGGYFPMSCRYTIAGFPYPPLQAAINTTETAEMLTVSDSSVINSRQVKSDGETYFVAVKQLRVTNGTDFVFPNLQWKVVYIMKETDITGPVIKGRNISMIAAVCVFIFFNIVAFVLLAVLLAPLGVVAEEMEVTSRLQDLGEPVGDLSFISEVANLETSYRALKAQLRRIRSFVPAGLLAQLDGDDDDDQELEDLEESQRASPAASIAEDPQPQGRPSLSRNTSLLAVSGTSAGNSRTSCGNSGSDFIIRRANLSGSETSPSPRTAANPNPLGNSGSATPRSSASRCSGSRRPSRRVSAIGPVTLDVELTRKRVALVHIRLPGFRSMVTGPNVGEKQKATAAHEKLLKYIAGRCKELRGVIDSYQDEAIIVTFNLSIHSAQAPKSALTLAMNVTKFVTDHPSGFMAHVGVSYNYVIAGTLGTDEMKRQCIVGCVGDQAEVLARMAQKQDCPILCPVSTLNDVLQVQFAIADVVPLPGERRCVVGCPTVLLVPDESKDLEWMYALQEGDKNNKYTAGNDAVRALLNRADPSKAEDYLMTETERDFVHHDYALHLIKRLLESPQPTTYLNRHEDYISSLGE